MPQIGSGVFLADGAVIVGHVEMGENASVWYGAVLRGDLGPIRVGKYSTIQDLACVHMSSRDQSVEIGEYVCIGQGALIRGALIEDGAFVGNGAIVMERTKIGAGSVVAAGALVARGTEIPARSLVRGRPARVIRPLNENEFDWGRREALEQRDLAERSESWVL